MDKKTKTPEGDQPEETAGRSEPVYKTKHVSTDVEAGIVVFDTDAPDGTGMTVTIDGDLVDGTAAAGQVWFYAGQPLSTSPFIYLK